MLDGPVANYHYTSKLRPGELDPFIDEAETGRIWQFTVTIPDGVGWMNWNDRTDRRAKTSVRQHYVDVGHKLALAHLPRRTNQLDRVRIICVCRFKDLIERDPPNFGATSKAVVDGMVKSGFIPDDNWRHVVGPDMRFGPLYHPVPGGPIGEMVVIVRELVVPPNLPPKPPARKGTRTRRPATVSGLTAAQRRQLPPGAKLWVGP
jgi:hypothetical protein